MQVSITNGIISVVTHFGWRYRGTPRTKPPLFFLNLFVRRGLQDIWHRHWQGPWVVNHCKSKYQVRSMLVTNQQTRSQSGRTMSFFFSVTDSPSSVTAPSSSPKLNSFTFLKGSRVDYWHDRDKGMLLTFWHPCVARLPLVHAAQPHVHAAAHASLRP